ncbi:MAG: homoserine O-acetyltransferase [Flavobacteriales bacterium]|nr:homoserine O-acetyltransferase [Flavobacteriales bacterium]MCB9364299.1 homoserine O-acetyltransferase [Flavobacteriales bacterium]
MSIVFKHKKKFQLESGSFLPEFQLAYTTLGKLNSTGDNVVWITHALTANSNPEEWWNGLVGKGKYFNPEKYFIVCANVLGSAYGSTGPLSINPDTGNKYYHNFPQLTIRDIVNGFEILKDHLKIQKIHTLLGGSLGGQQALEWSIINPSLIENLILIATNAKHSPWGIAFNESQRLAIKADRSWYSYSDDAGLKGLKAARSFALLSYRNYNTYQATQEDNRGVVDDFKAASYQNYQGEKLVNRFNAFSYWVLSKAMDSHDVSRGRKSISQALSQVKANTLVVAVNSDLLFPVSESILIADNIKDAELEVIDSLYGHDGFLIETDQLKELFEKFYLTQKLKIKRYEYA